MMFLFIIIVSLHTPSPLFLFASESSKETEQQKTCIMLAEKHPENKATEITGNFRASYTKIIYQVYIAQAEV